MNKTFLFLILILSFFLLTACHSEVSSNKLAQENDSDATNILIESTSIALKENDTSWTYEILFQNNNKIINLNKSELPFQRIVVLSASSIGYLEALNGLDQIVGVFDPQWIYSPALHDLIKEKPELNQGNLAGLSLEKILMLQPDVVLAHSDPNASKTFQRLEEAGILVLYIDEYNEKTPLGKAEFLKLFGILLNQEEKAEQLFQEIRSNYLELKTFAEQQQVKPSVFADIMRGDIWYMPGGESFAAQYFKDAGADYLWSDHSEAGSLKLNFEQVFEKAAHADVWMNAADLHSLTHLQQAYIHHDWFDAFKNARVYSLSNRMSPAGANDYFETGAVRADWVLKDLVHIFHPTLLPDHSLYFYHQLD